MNGAQMERELIHCLDALGWVAIRSPASGTAPREQPDVLAAKAATVIVGELKSGDPPRNPEDGEIRDLRTFAEGFLGSTLVIARFKGERAFYFVPPEAMDRTPSGHYSIPNAPDRLPWGVKLKYGPAGPDNADIDVTPTVRPYDDQIDDMTPADQVMDWVSVVGINQAERASHA